MPTISVGRDRLFAVIGRSYTQEEFDDLCFSFGIELDDVTTEKAIISKEKHLEEEKPSADDEIIYKIEVPANRYDLLCLEGLAQALRIFNEQEKIPRYTVAKISKESMLKMHVRKETSLIRPFVVCAVLRDVTFDEANYNSFIDLQDKLHQNICRKRTLVAIGTHDLDTLQGPFTYEALPPPEINFVPLKQVKNFRADELMEFYKSDLKLKKFLHIIENSSVFPVIYDRNRTVLSLPPIINGAHSAITLKTKNVFIECKATDLTKAKIVLNTMVTTFSTYCKRKLEVEPVEVISFDGNSSVYPDLSEYNMEVPLSYITGSIGVPMEVDEDDKSTAVVIGNPRSSDFEVVRTSLMPGMLKTAGHNKDHPKPIKIYEVGDVVLLDDKKDVGASNRRLLAALYCGANSGFELIHSLVDRIMEVMGTPFVPVGDKSGYYIELSDASV